MTRAPKILVVVIGVLCVSFVVGHSIKSAHQQSEPILTPVALSTQKEAYGLPVRLIIPKIQVDATVESLGLTKEGAIGAPEGPEPAAWFNMSSRPGEIGNSIIDGHSGWKDGIPAVFDNLHMLQKGDKIYVQDEQGSTITFVVTSLRNYDLQENRADVFESKDGKAHLVLITCEGIWDPVTQTSSERLVVFADRG